MANDPNKPTQKWDDFINQMNSWKDPDTGNGLSDDEKRQAAKIWFNENVRPTRAFQQMSESEVQDVLGYLNLLDPKGQEVISQAGQRQDQIMPDNRNFLQRFMARNPMAQKTKDFLAQDAAQNIGGQVGELVGGRFGVQALGAGLGGMMGQAGGDIYATVTGSPRRPASIMEALGRAGMAFAEEGATTKGSDIALRALKGGNRLAKSMAGATDRSPINYAVEGAETLQDTAKSYGTTMLPDQLQTRGIWNRATPIVEKTMSGGILQDVRKAKQPASVRKLTNDTMARMFGNAKFDAGEMAELVGDAMSGSRRTFDAMTGMMYNSFRQNTSDVLVDGALAKKTAQDLLENQDFLGILGKTERGIEQLKAITELPDTMTFAQADEARSTILAIRRRLDQEAVAIAADKPRASGALKKAESAFTDVMRSALKDSDPTMLEAFDSIRKFKAEGEGMFGKDMVKKLASFLEKERPAGIASMVFSGGSPEAVMELRKLMSPEAFQSLKHGFIDEILRKNSGQVIGDPSIASTLSGARFIEHFPFGDQESTGAMSKKMFDAVFTPDEQAALKRLGNYAFRTQAYGDGSGSIAFSLLEIGAGSQLASGVAKGSMPAASVGGRSLAILFASSESVSKALTKPEFVDWAIRSTEAPKGSLHAVTAFIRAQRLAKRYDKDVKRDREQKIMSDNNKGFIHQKTMGSFR